MRASNEIKKGRGLLFDVLITVLILGSIGVGLYYMLKPESTDKVKIEYRIVFDTVDKNIASNISPNDVFLSEEGESMGVITDALNDKKIFQTIDRTSAAKGYVTNISNEYNTVRITVSATAVLKDGVYYVGGQAVRTGGQLTLRLPDFYGTATVTALTVIK